MISEPLGLPKGSVRAILAITLTVFLGFCLFFGKEIPGEVSGLWIAFVGYYLGVRTKELQKE